MENSLNDSKDTKFEQVDDDDENIEEQNLNDDTTAETNDEEQPATRFAWRPSQCSALTAKYLF